MITLEAIQKLKTKYQTTELNIVREYCQHIFLSSLYQHKEASSLLFKGGTALRIIYGSPRFSEDLDFSSSLPIQNIEGLIEKNLMEIERSGMKVDIREAKETSGGYLAIILFHVLSFINEIYIEISKRDKKALSSHTAIIHSDFVPGYTIEHLAADHLIKEKIEATLSRSKPRDFFDIYFLLRSQLIPVQMKKKFSLILKQLESKEIDFSRELKRFLPINQHLIIKNFKQTLKKELLFYRGSSF